jgi:hypothetical protein
VYNATEQVVAAFLDRLGEGYRAMYSNLEPDYPGMIAWAGRMAMESIANSDALYHDVEHTIMVTLVGQEILRGKHLREGGVSPRDWLHVMISLLCHDIGYVRGVCPGDGDGRCVVDLDGGTVVLPVGATDAALTPYHVERGKLFVRARFGTHPVIEAEVIAANIDHTQFPLPDSRESRGTGYPALVGAADLIGQMADFNYLRKLPALFHEFEEIGANAKMGYRNPGDLKRGYPKFYWSTVDRHIARGLDYLKVTQDGRQWAASLYSHLFAVEHRDKAVVAAE